MAILPSTLKEKLALAVTGDDGMVYSYTVSFNGDFPYEAGKVYNSELTFINGAADGLELLIYSIMMNERSLGSE